MIDGQIESYTAYMRALNESLKDSHPAMQAETQALMVATQGVLDSLQKYRRVVDGLRIAQHCH
ncbi:hypothetical protein [Paraburkholderia fungorum]|uniref:hypothetical protein n=1 Tax=Paraburkholderia fungorum TaxID=134537 RepID=UPI000B294CDD|nr:hypothetical protein [Paraburkholderia fungorum]MBB5546518.1 hypothetical protein [Paraburkholderia fungorum]